MSTQLLRAAAHKYYATVGADVDLLVDLKALIDAGTKIAAPRPTAFLVAGTAGDLVFVSSSGTQDQVYLAAGVPMYVEAVKLIAAGTSAAKITACW